VEGYSRQRRRKSRAAGGPARGVRATCRVFRLKIIYTRGNRTETLASIATLRKILNRFVAHRVFYEVSSRNKRGHEFFSCKNTFVVGSIEIVNRDYLTITIFDANSASHSIEILNPAAMRIYDDTLGTINQGFDRGMSMYKWLDGPEVKGLNAQKLLVIKSGRNTALAMNFDLFGRNGGIGRRGQPSDSER